ncbi:hypothetical protein EJ05DRAFT_187037 [Pseudovirgaria hyperparasitica]|uniref:RWD domain-containing protein n=1 Tax=Pseudovirgaria hyperparasitica TaxID=470096 RepID=A0A6A6WHZ6_9PEZI|nr:uncharacterized protein EJ05DRAFT_187037 [Pseudovirgaria hyperparasitica]KAF2761859.1 hypothetical protein EJ05DRAFT_187037 [Pseudovirgaria hyperparasitica]
MSEDEQSTRVAVETSLLESMYPDSIQFDTNLQDLTYTTLHAKLIVRLPSTYPASSPPDIISAFTKGTHHVDLRSQMKGAVARLPVGEEILDSVIAAFDRLVEESVHDSTGLDPISRASGDESADEHGKKTVLIWLHHLLNTSKRKQALASADAAISGVSKPGYPGVLIFSGAATNVDEHVNGLKGLNWAAFQVRLEKDEEWVFSHGTGVKEVESMADVVREIGEERKEVFLEVMKMK